MADKAGSSSGDRQKKFRKRMREELGNTKIPEDRIKEAEDYVNKNGIEGLGDFLEEQMNEFKKCKVNIAITGGSGQGKSSFINLIRGLRSSDEGYAEVGVTETTMEPKAYAHPDMPNILFWDLPGCGTEAFKKDDYIEETGMKDNYDAIIICGSTRFTDNDMMIAKAAFVSKVPFYIVRTKIDLDVYNASEENDDFDENELLETVRSDVYKNLRSLNKGGRDLIPDDVFLISTKLKHSHKWDFPKLITKLTTSAPQKNQEAMILALKNVSQNGVDLKKDVLVKRIPGKISAIRHSDRKKSEIILQDEVELYIKQFSLTEKNMKDIDVGRAKRNEILTEVNDLKKSIKIASVLKTVHKFNPMGRVVDKIAKTDLCKELAEDIEHDEEAISDKLSTFLHGILDKFEGIGIKMIAAALRL